MNGIGVPREGAARGEDRYHSDARSDHGRERERGDDADPVAQPPHHRDLHRAGDAGDETQADRQRVPARHRPDASD
jgi:hypothetical protein